MNPKEELIGWCSNTSFLKSTSISSHVNAIAGILRPAAWRTRCKKRSHPLPQPKTPNNRILTTVETTQPNLTPSSHHPYRTTGQPTTSGARGCLSCTSSPSFSSSTPSRTALLTPTLPSKSLCMRPGVMQHLRVSCVTVSPCTSPLMKSSSRLMQVRGRQP